MAYNRLPYLVAASLLTLPLSLTALDLVQRSTAQAQSGCDALLKAAKKGYRGDPEALEECRKAKRRANAGKGIERAHRAQSERDQREAEAYESERSAQDAAVAVGEAIWMLSRGSRSGH